MGVESRVSHGNAQQGGPRIEDSEHDRLGGADDWDGDAYEWPEEGLSELRDDELDTDPEPSFVDDYTHRVRRSWWPGIDTAESAQHAARQVSHSAAIISAGAMILPVLFRDRYQDLGAAPWIVIVAIALIWAALAVGIRSMSRIASVAALAFYAVFVVAALADSSWLIVFVGFFFGLVFANGVRACFAYHRMS